MVRRCLKLKETNWSEFMSIHQIVKKYSVVPNLYFIGGYLNAPYGFLTKEKVSTLNESPCRRERQEEHLCQSCNSQWTDLKPEQPTQTKIELPFSRTEGYRIIESNGIIFITGGLDADKFKQLRSVFSFDGVKWGQLPPMAQGRFHHAVSATDSELYIVGGYQQERVLNTVEIYNFHSRAWRFGAEMLLGVGGAAFCSHKDYLYICCGQYSVRAVHTTDKIQRYSIRKDQWEIFSRYISPGTNEFVKDGLL